MGLGFVVLCEWTRSIFWSGSLPGAWVMGCNVFVPSPQFTRNMPLYSMWYIVPNFPSVSVSCLPMQTTILVRLVSYRRGRELCDEPNREKSRNRESFRNCIIVRWWRYIFPLNFFFVLPWVRCLIFLLAVPCDHCT